MTFDPKQPYKNIDGVNINLTDAEIAANEIAAAAYAAQAPITAMNQQAMLVLAEADKTMLRIQEAISLGLTTALATDVVAWVNYRKSLRTLVTSTTAQSLPSKPAYPSGT